MKLLTVIPAILFTTLLLSCKKDLRDEKKLPLSNEQNIKVEEAFPGQNGILKMAYLGSRRINYEVINGFNVFQKDIILTDKQISSSPQTSGRTTGAVIEGNFRWANEIVPFTIDPNFPDQFRVNDAIADWQTHTAFRFVPRTTEADFVTFVPVPGGGGASNVGRIGGQQLITIGNDAVTGVLVHEIGHAIGLFHEHQRVDRDNSITINFDNILQDPNILFQFNTYEVSGINGFDAEAFDINSIMMYPSFIPNWSIDPTIPLITRVNGTTFNAQRIALSPLDMDVATTLLGFSGWVNLGGNLASKPVATSRSQNSINVFGRNASNQLMHIFWTGSTWSTWENLGGTFQGAPATSKRGTSIVDVFVRGTNNHLYHRYWQNNAWSNWMDLGGNITSSPTSVSRTSTKIDVFARGQNGELVQIFWNGSSWSSWQNLGGNFIGDPTVSSRGINSVDVFCRGTNNQLLQRSWNGSSWLAWTDLGGQLASNPSSVSWGSDRIDMFYRTNNGLFEHRAWSNATGWVTRAFGGLLTVGDPFVTSQAFNSLNLFSLNANNQLMHKWYN